MPSRLDSSSPASVFEHAMTAFEGGTITYTDLLAQASRLLNAGAPARDLLDLLMKREAAHPLPPIAHAELVALFGGTPLMPDLAAAKLRASSLAAELKAARSAIKIEQQRAREAEAGLLDATRAMDAAVLELQHTRDEFQSLRDAATRSETHLADSQAVTARVSAQLLRTEGLLAAASSELETWKSQCTVYLDALRTREWRREVVPRARGARRRISGRIWMFGCLAASGVIVFLWTLRKPPAVTRPAVVAVATVATNSTVAAVAGAARVPSTPGMTFQDCPSCPSLTILPSGRFKQGTVPARGRPAAHESPIHWVLIERPLAFATNPITVDEYADFVAATGRDMEGCDAYDGTWKASDERNWKNPGYPQTGSHPVTCTSWNDADAYALWLSAKSGRRYRLPSASEWEFAARAGDDGIAPWAVDGTTPCENADVADKTAGRRFPGWNTFACEDGYVYTAPVGSFKANAFGLHDMLGNVFQWTQDCWHDNYVNGPVDGTAWVDVNCADHELRGGSWFSMPAYVRPAYRNHFGAAYRTSTVGIRVVRELDP